MMNQSPTNQHVVKWRGQDVTVLEFCLQSDEPWDGDFPLDPGSEGYDLFVEVNVTLGGHTFSAGAQVAGNWITPGKEGNDYLDSQTKDLVDEALSNLADEVSRVASGKDVRREEERRNVAVVLQATA